jgi:S1-C subfamily serine protease
MALVLLLATACAQGDPAARRHARVAEVVASTLQVVVEGSAGRQFGSGVILTRSAEGDRALVLTSAHVLASAQQGKISVVSPFGGDKVSAQLLALDEARDLALLEAAVAGSPARLLSHAHLTDAVWVVGYPWGRARTVVGGAISQVARAPDAASPIAGPVTLIDAPVTYGMSGGGVFERAEGRLVALVRGYRTANLSLDSQSEPLRIPIAGETTVIPIPTIACFLSEQKTRVRSFGAATPPTDCTASSESR